MQKNVKTPRFDAPSCESRVKFAAGLGLGARPTLAALRALPAADLLRTPANPGAPWCKPTLDGYFFPKHPREIYAAGEQAHVPLLAGVNSEESGSSGVLGTQPPLRGQTIV